MSSGQASGRDMNIIKVDERYSKEYMSESQFEKLFWTQYYTGENVCRWPVSVYVVDSLPKIHYLYQKATRSSIGIDYLH